MNEVDGTPRWQARTTILGAVVAGALIAALILVLQAATRQRDRALEVQQASYEAMILARSVDATMGRAEAMLGRFVISGEDAKDLGRLYYDDWRLAGAQLDALAAQVTDPASKAEIGRLSALYRARGRELSDVALRTNYGQNQGALSKFYDAGRSPNVRAIAATLDRIIEIERGVLDARTRAAESQIGRTNSLGTLLAFVGILLVLGGAALAWRIVEASREQRDEEARAQALEDAVAARTGELSEANQRLRAEMVEREAAEERLRQAQKLEAIGQLTGGIAHDFNNMLSVVIGGLELAKRRAGGAPDAVAHLDQAMEGAVRAAALTRRLLSFARSEPLSAAPAHAGQLTAGMADLLDRVIGDTIRVRIEAREHGAVLIDAHQLENAILNLAVNARDAMPDGGLLTIDSEDRVLAAGEVEDLPAGRYVAISVTDNGTGMSPEVRARIFEPFFTTKAVNEGTGLGLSQIFGFARQSGGAVTVASELGHGTTVTLFLPQYHVEADTPLQPALVSAEPTSGGERVILVIEDDPRVLHATVATLRELGHVAIACAGPTAALDLLHAHPDVDLIVSDVMMPDMTGPQLITTIHRHHPGLPALFVTGFAGDETEESFSGFQVLRKPFTIAQLEAAIAAAPVPTRLHEAA